MRDPTLRLKKGTAREAKYINSENNFNYIHFFIEEESFQNLCTRVSVQQSS